MLISNNPTSNNYSVNTQSQLQPASGGATSAAPAVAKDSTSASNGFQVLRGGSSNGGGVTTDLDLVGLASAIWDAIVDAAATAKQAQQEHWNRS
jgi:hypothetical protein